MAYRTPEDAYELMIWEMESERAGQIYSGVDGERAYCQAHPEVETDWHESDPHACEMATNVFDFNPVRWHLSGDTFDLDTIPF